MCAAQSMAQSCTDILFTARCQITPDTTKYLGTGGTPKAARYFLLNFGHPNRIFSSIIGKWHTGLCHEAQYILFKINKPFQ
jgi:hypothetical protein